MPLCTREQASTVCCCCYSGAHGLLSTVTPTARASCAPWGQGGKGGGGPLCDPAGVSAAFGGPQRPPVVAWVRHFAAKRKEAFMLSVRDTVARAVVVHRSRAQSNQQQRSACDVSAAWSTPDHYPRVDVQGYCGGGGGEQRQRRQGQPQLLLPLWVRHDWRLVTAAEVPAYTAAGWKTVLSPAALPAYFDVDSYYSEGGVADEFQVRVRVD